MYVTTDVIIEYWLLYIKLQKVGEIIPELYIDAALLYKCKISVGIYKGI